ncbi:30S ribosomal protein S7 [candidate division KSB1 bacterium]|nr:MAG: 30S ribosomal protein S7 [candidate division KSB1 bacterium]
MPRRRRVPKRKVLPDPVYHQEIVTKFINGLMKGGKRSLAEDIFYSAMDIIEKRTGDKGIDVFHKAIENVKPIIEVKSRRVGGATYQVPVEIPSNRRAALAFRWVINFSRARSEKTMAERLAGELIDASKKEGTSIKKREDVHKMAEANKAFAHFRW